MGKQWQLLGPTGLSAYDVLHKDHGARPRREKFFYTERQGRRSTTADQRSTVPAHISGKTARAAYVRGRVAAEQGQPAINPYGPLGPTIKMHRAWAEGYSATKKKPEPSEHLRTKKRRPAG